MAKGKPTKTTVYKYGNWRASQLDDVVDVVMPAGAEILSVVNQKETLVVYARVDPDKPADTVRRFRCAGTGHPLSQRHELTFLGTVMFMGGDFVLHVFEIENPG